MLGFRQMASSGFVACGLAQPEFARVWALNSPDDLLVLEEETPPEPTARIGYQLLAAGAVTVNGLAEALAYQPRVPGRRLGWILVMLGHLEQEDLDRVLAARVGAPCVTLRKFRPRRDCVRRIPVGTARRLGIALLEEDARCAWVAFANAADRSARDAASFLLGKRVVALQAGKREIDAYLERHDPAGSAPNNPYYDDRPRRGDERARAIPLDRLDFVEFHAA